MPAGHAANELASEGLVTETEQNPLEPLYNGPGEVIGSGFPTEFSEYFDAFARPGAAD